MIGFILIMPSPSAKWCTTHTVNLESLHRPYGGQFFGQVVDRIEGKYQAILTVLDTVRVLIEPHIVSVEMPLE